MNCRETQEKITDSFASGALALSPDALEHQGICHACRAFLEERQRFFASIDAGLQCLVNQPVPLSCFVRVRARLEEEPAPRSPWTLRCTYAALAATMFLILSGSVLRRQFHGRDSSPGANRVVAPVGRKPALAPPPSSDETARLLPAPTHLAAPIPSGQPDEAVAEVIVLAEEKQAFARFVAGASQGVGVPYALKPSVPQQADTPVDIALIEIQDVEISPLDSMNGDGQ